MTDFPLHDTRTAPEAAKPQLEGAQQTMGFIPNIFAKMAEAPAVLEGYASISGIFDKTSLSPVEREVVLLTTSVEHRVPLLRGRPHRPGQEGRHAGIGAGGPGGPAASSRTADWRRCAPIPWRSSATAAGSPTMPLTASWRPAIHGDRRWRSSLA
ncbi:MAG: hypothetical protein U5L11_07610 [Arhodomonas sp.]|nr:hypothetical protein [Arhodomonas sp.]